MRGVFWQKLFSNIVLIFILICFITTFMASVFNHVGNTYLLLGHLKNCKPLKELLNMVNIYMIKL